MTVVIELIALIVKINLAKRTNFCYTDYDEKWGVIGMGVGLRLKSILRERKITIKKLAEIADIPVNTLYSITKRDSERVDAVIIQRISDALNIPASALTGRNDERAGGNDNREDVYIPPEVMDDFRKGLALRWLTTGDDTNLYVWHIGGETEEDALRTMRELFGLIADVQDSPGLSASLVHQLLDMARARGDNVPDKTNRNETSGKG